MASRLRRTGIDALLGLRSSHLTRAYANLAGRRLSARCGIGESDQDQPKAGTRSSDNEP
jgi:hypothetical protein